MAFELPDLPYDHDALAPHIDEQTMKIHHGKHHAGYTRKLNNAIEGSSLEDESIEDILSGVSKHGSDVRNNGGGFYNHALFWSVMSPDGGGDPSGDLADDIDDRFDSIDGFKEEFSKAAKGQFGSGWAWLLVDNANRLVVTSTPNQDNPLMDVTNVSGTPILGIDVWEHAYYLNYQNKRPDYIEAWWNVVNWDEVSRRYDEAKS